MNEAVTFGPYTREFLDLSWTWLRDPELKELTLSPDFDRQAQEDWFNSLPNKRWYLIWGVRFNGQPVGACGLKMDGARGEYWGYIGEKSHWGKGIGVLMLRHVEAQAQTRGITQLWLKVGSRNQRALSVYERFGFCIDSEASTSELVIMTKPVLPGTQNGGAQAGCSACTDAATRVPAGPAIR